jgi:hypothetical protein
MSPSTPTGDAHPVRDLVDDTDPDVITVLLTVPELAPTYLRLAALADDDPGAAALFGEMADQLTELLARGRGDWPIVSRILQAVEHTAATSLDAEELVVWSFLDALSPTVLGTIRSRLGPATVRLLEDVDEPGLP